MPDSTPLVGHLVGGAYRVLSVIGQGGMGTVYAAVHQPSGRRVALKVLAGSALSESAEALARFEREARVARAIDSDHVVRLLDSGVDAVLRVPFLAMELVVGADLDQLIQRIGPLSPDVALRLAAHACEGLRKAHEAGVIHRDIKPQNLYLARGERGEVLLKILDFGIAKLSVAQAADHALTRTGTLVGSPVFMSPEQARGDRSIDHRTDLWSLGAVLYEALSGRPPHADVEGLGALLFAITSEPVHPIQEVAPWVTPEIAAIVHRALSIDPAERFQSAAHMLAPIRALLESGSALNEWMLRPLSAAEREIAAPRWSQSAASPRSVSSVSFDTTARRTGAPVPSSTAPAVHSVGAPARAEAARKPSRTLLSSIAVVFAVVAIGGLAAWKVLAPSPVVSAAPSTLSAVERLEPTAEARAAEPAPSNLPVGGPTVLPVSPDALRAAEVTHSSKVGRAHTPAPPPSSVPRGRLIRQSLD